MIEPLTEQEVMQLVAANHAVYVYPRKQVVTIDGWKRRVVKGVKDWQSFAATVRSKQSKQ